MKWKFWVQSLKPRYQDIWKRAGASFSTPLDNECNDTFNFLQKAYKGIRSGRAGKVSDSSWMEHFISSGDPLEHEAFLALWLSRFVLVCPRNHIAIQDFHVAIHLSRGNRIALAPVVLACIYRDMSLLHNSIFESNKFESLVGLNFMSCHCDLVQMWVWERFLGLRPVPDVVERGEPRSARWNGVTKLKVNDVRKELDSAGVSFVWRPYAIVLSNSILSNLYKDTEQWGSGRD
ncbi:hypothetical protein POM88_025803 [Heracleum sosnowskyi]|uniref:Aminotransferase-like plant mobile domain-containing protein n=1 Tax=Heracleum sosnowskyi TaxID=360622 RepID=A0AAD8I4L0_9APIA|nr:hypothetical protein POM88_025803 [Heracleum sosnowskyi]